MKIKRKDDIIFLQENCKWISKLRKKEWQNGKKL